MRRRATDRSAGMSSGVAPVSRRPGSLPPALSRVGWLVSVLLFGALPVFAVVVFFTDTIDRDVVAVDFWQFYWAADAIVSGVSPYILSDRSLTVWGGPYPYPPLPALVAAPLTVLSLEAASLIVMGVLVIVALAVPFVLGVRDWRCYGVAILWPPVTSAIQTGNLTLWFALAAALAWRYRDRTIIAGAIVGATLAAKFFLWPLAIWFAATRRFISAVLAFAVGSVLLLVSWAVIGFAGLVDYPRLLRQLEDTVGTDSYTAYIVGLDLGLPAPISRGIWIAIGLALLGCVVALGRKGHEQTAFVVAIAASLGFTPIVWLHYFALLLVIVALAKPRLGLIWFVPILMVITPGTGHPSPFETGWTLSVALLTIVLAVRGTWLGTNAIKSSPGSQLAVRE